ncbi:aladin isoform X2 [Syngnathoides biaculeatus]|uniref:aladin isoform X2 n=1 Tax=Syngnathoides biaculeatus TaxID=300417 RepID=UPI002ADD58F2|nr:aladin isoform X2 [Syngnathoides biaculeatus]
MCSLALFPPPLPSGHTTLCESNNELLAGTNVEDRLQQESSPQSLYFARESLKPHSRTESSSSKAAFLDHSETLWMRSAAAWRDAGFTGLLNEISNSGEEVPKWLSVSTGCILALLQRISSFHSSLFPHLTLSSEDMIAEFSQVLNWSDCVVRAFAWHPHTDKFAVALLDDSIKIYNPKRPSSGCAQVLAHPGHSPVTSIAWSPNGSLLVSASPMDTSMMVWDVAAESCVALQRIGGGGVSFLSWSPDGSHLLASTPSALFRVWETRMWTCERWPCEKGRCQSGCWSPDGSRLLFTVQGETVIYALTFTDTPGTSKGPQAASVVADLSQTTFETPEGDVTVGGEIQSLTWDPRGERLAVLLKGGPGQPAIIPVFKTRTKPIFELLPCGFVQGDPGAQPRLMQFRPNFQHGALLTVCWSTGRISHVPFYFLSGNMGRSGLNGSPSLPRPQEHHTDLANQSLFTELMS